MTESIVVIIEDARAQRTWHKLLSIISECICNEARRVRKIVPVKGTHGYRLVNAIKTLRVKYSNSIIVVTFDIDIYNSENEAISKISQLINKAIPNDTRFVSLLPVVEKLEDWIFSLIKGKICKCCGIEGLSRYIGDKYKKYMTAKQIPNLLENNKDKICKNIKYLMNPMGFNNLIDILCINAKL